jgi:F-type H+-transporting ATPase subunit epsilon
MAKTMQCNVVSAEQSLFQGDVVMVIATGELGDLGIVPGHAPLITSLRPGPVRLQFENGDDELFFVSGGFLEVIPTQITILADAADRAENLDETAALDAQAEATRLLADQQSEFDHAGATMALDEAVARLRVIEQLRRRRA